MKQLAILLASASLAACAVGPDYAPPDVAPLTPAAFEDSGAAATSPDWWTVLQDPVLTGLVGDAFAANRDLRTAEANVRAARAALGERRFDLAPTVTAEGVYARSRTSAAALGARIPVFDATDAFQTTNLFDAGLNASWELDFWGRVRRSVQAARADADIAEADYRNALVIVEADVASAYITLRGAERRLAVAQGNAALQRDTLGLTQSLFDGGRASALDTARASAQLETTLSTIPPLEQAITAQRRRLAVLTGRAPDALATLLDDARTLPALPAGAPSGDPALTLRQRPDVRAAERALAGATAKVGVATGDLFPRVSFTGSFGASSSTLAAYGSTPSIDYGFGPTLSWAALDLGRVRARIRQADFASQAALAAYEQTVLGALEETANAFTGYARERERADRLARAVAANRDAVRLSDVRYQSGVDDFLAVIDAQRSLFQAEDQAAESDTNALLNLVLIYRALGGGWMAQS